MSKKNCLALEEQFTDVVVEKIEFTTAFWSLIEFYKHGKEGFAGVLQHPPLYDEGWKQVLNMFEHTHRVQMVVSCCCDHTIPLFLRLQSVLLVIKNLWNDEFFVLLSCSTHWRCIVWDLNRCKIVTIWKHMLLEIKIPFLWHTFSASSWSCNCLCRKCAQYQVSASFFLVHKDNFWVMNVWHNFCGDHVGPCVCFGSKRK